MATANSRPGDGRAGGRGRALEQETLRQAQLFPRVYETYRHYVEHPLDSGQLLDLQYRRLHALLERTLVTVPAMRAYGVPVSPDDDPFDVLRRLPATTREHLSGQFADRVADDLDPADCSWHASSGTTGVPLKIVKDSAHMVHMYALGMRRYLEYGLPLDRTVLSPSRFGPTAWTEYTALTTGFLHCAEFPPLDELGTAEREATARRCREYRPNLTFCAPTQGYELKCLLSQFPGNRFETDVVVTYGAQLTSHLRQELTDFFQVPLYDHYGLTEVGTVAAQCTHGRYHIDCERLWVEVLDPEGRAVPDGTEGEITITNLMNAAFPLVRYRTNDRGALDTDDCPCGRPQKTMRVTQGRIDVGKIRFADGSASGVRPVVWHVEQFPVAKMQIIQESIDRLRVLVKPLPSFTAAHLPKLAAAIRTELRDRIGVEVQVAGEADFGPRAAGKLIPFVPLRSAAVTVDT